MFMIAPTKAHDLVWENWGHDPLFKSLEQVKFLLCGTRRFDSCSTEAASDRTVDDLVSAGVLSALFPELTVRFNAESVEFALHTDQQLFRRGGADPGAFEIPNLTPRREDACRPAQNGKGQPEAPA
jgi:hypothetical protein